jgi:hypothetical protein
VPFHDVSLIVRHRSQNRANLSRVLGEIGTNVAVVGGGGSAQYLLAFGDPSSAVPRAVGGHSGRELRNGVGSTATL